MLYGYCRVSTKTQSIDRQIKNIKELYPEAVIYQESYTGTKIDRPQFTKMLRKLKEGDTVVFDSVSRFSRDAEEGFKLYQKLFEKGINLIFLKEHHIDTDTYKAALQSSVGVEINTNDKDTDTFVNGMLKLVNDYIMSLAKKQITIAFDQAQKEVDDIHQRTKEGIAVARSKGKQIGRTKLDKDLTEYRALVQEGKLTVTQACQQAGCSRAYWYKNV